MLSYDIEVLKIINDEDNISQRRLAEMLNISLGKINSLLKELLTKEYIVKIDIDKRNIKYELTEAGIALLENSLDKVKSTKLSIHKHKYHKVKQAVILGAGGKGVKYELTEAGIALLENSLDKVKSTKLSIHKHKYHKVKQAVILGAGGKGDFGKPAGFLELEEFRIIDRIIDILKSNGIEKIVIVNGYKKEYYEELAEKDSTIFCVTNSNYKWTGTMSSLALAKEYIDDDFILVENKEYYEELAEKDSTIFCVTNSNYKWTGTMSSLALAKEYIDDDFILVENDLVFESRAIEQIIKNDNRDCVLITNESGSGDEAFVEIRDGYLFKMSKDVHQFNKIDGEMIGISKISYKLFKMMLEEFKHNINPYMNYEYTMLDVARNYKVGYEKINDLVWGEIDNKDQYEKVKKHIIPMIKRKEMQYKIDQVKSAIVNGLKVSEEEVKEIVPVGGMTNKNYKAFVNDKAYIVRIPGLGTSSMINRRDEMINSKLAAIVPVGGMTNKNYKAFVNDKAYIVRIPGLGTSSMINRRDEMINSKLAADEGIDAKILFFDEESGVKIAELIKGAETLNPATAKKKENMELVVGALRTLHNSEIKMENKFNVIEVIKSFRRSFNGNKTMS